MSCRSIANRLIGRTPLQISQFFGHGDKFAAFEKSQKAKNELKQREVALKETRKVLAEAIISEEKQRKALEESKKVREDAENDMTRCKSLLEELTI